MHQHGLRNGRSRVKHLTEVLDYWTSQFDNRNSIDVIYFDFQKAFDIVPKQKLLNKLHSCGICGNVHGWIRDFLTKRQQKVVINVTGWNWRTVTNGIPQGSVLGPILFTIYMNDLPDVVLYIKKLFAVDTKLYPIVNDEEDQLSLQNDKMVKLMAPKFSKSKYKHVYFGQHTNYQYKMDEWRNYSTGNRRKTPMDCNRTEILALYQLANKREQPTVWNDKKKPQVTWINIYSWVI